MNRSQFLAALVIVGVLGALVAGRIRSGDEAGSNEAAVDAAAQPEENAGIASATAKTGDGSNETGTADDSAADDSATEEQAAAEPLVVAEPPPILDPKPALTNIDGWINTDATSLDDFAGQVRVVEFWTFGCFNCKNRISHTQELYAEFQPQGLEIIGVHAPEFERERDPAAVEQATKDLGVTWPVALDTQKTNFRAWQSNRRFWPRVFVLDQNGDVRYDHIGEGDYDGLEETVAYLIENGP